MDIHKTVLDDCLCAYDKCIERHSLAIKQILERQAHLIATYGKQPNPTHHGLALGTWEEISPKSENEAWIQEAVKIINRGIELMTL